MRIDNPPPLVSPVKDRREVRGLTSVPAVKAVGEEGQARQQAAARQETERTSPPPAEQRGVVLDRRKVCRRVRKQAVLIELRSGVDRRKVDQRDGDVRIHIDAQA